MKGRNVEIVSNTMETDGSSHQDDLVQKKGSNVSSVVWKWFGCERITPHQFTVFSNLISIRFVKTFPITLSHKCVFAKWI